MQVELDKGLSLEDLRKKTTKGEVQTKVPKQTKVSNQPAKGGFSNGQRVQRKKRDIMSILTKFDAKPMEENISPEPEVLSAIKQFSMDKEAHIDDPIVNKKIYKLGDKELLVCV